MLHLNNKQCPMQHHCKYLSAQSVIYAKKNKFTLHFKLDSCT